MIMRGWRGGEWHTQRRGWHVIARSGDSRADFLVAGLKRDNGLSVRVSGVNRGSGRWWQPRFAQWSRKEKQEATTMKVATATKPA